MSDRIAVQGAACSAAAVHSRHICCGRGNPCRAPPDLRGRGRSDHQSQVGCDQSNQICIALPKHALEHRPGSGLPGLHAASVAAGSFPRCCSQNAWCTVELMHLAALSSSQEDAAAALASKPDSACRAEASSSLIQEELAASLSQLMPLVYLLFFGLTGASLKLVGRPVATQGTFCNPSML